MATTEQRQALLSVTCPWCLAPVGELCTLRGRVRVDDQGAKRRPPARQLTTLDGGCHDARWRKALGVEAPVIREAVLETQAVAPRILVDAGDQRPW